MKIVLLGTGTPNAEPWASGPSFAVISGGRAYLIDAGCGVVRSCTNAFYSGIEELRPQNLNTVFLTHLHSDHTAGLADVILTPWVLERREPLSVYGPKGTENMVSHLKSAYQEDIGFRIGGPEKADRNGIRTAVHEISEGVVFDSSDMRVTAVRVSHGTLESFGYVFEAEGKKAVFSGDTRPVDQIAAAAEGADILIHEAEYTEGLQERDEKWRIYHSRVHTLSKDLADIMNRARPKLTVTVHRILHLNYYGEAPVPYEEVRRREEKLLEEIREVSACRVINGHDMDVFEI
ncbi:MAG: MBL fold metallo-hydrolase [Solobacterium sp.]|nr:MBL fold metallo-hydrolase [Solobacterium sp.]